MGSKLCTASAIVLTKHEPAAATSVLNGDLPVSRPKALGRRQYPPSMLKSGEAIKILDGWT